MKYESYFRRQLDGLHREGRYRVFADIERKAGAFPRARHHNSGGAGEGSNKSATRVEPGTQDFDARVRVIYTATPAT